MRSLYRRQQSYPSPPPPRQRENHEGKGRWISTLHVALPLMMTILHAAAGLQMPAIPNYGFGHDSSGRQSEKIQQLCYIMCTWRSKQEHERLILGAMLATSDGFRSIRQIVPSNGIRPTNLMPEEFTREQRAGCLFGGGHGGLWRKQLPMSALYLEFGGPCLVPGRQPYRSQGAWMWYIVYSIPREPTRAGGPRLFGVKLEAYHGKHLYTCTRITISDDMSYLPGRQRLLFSPDFHSSP